MSSEQAVCHHRATCAAGFKQCQAQVTTPSPMSKAGLIYEAAAWHWSLFASLAVRRTWQGPGGSTAASPNSARPIEFWRGRAFLNRADRSRQMISPHLHLKINGAEQIDRSLIAGAHASPNLVEANEYAADLRRAPSRPARISRFPALSEVGRAILRDTRRATRPDPRE